MKNYKEVFQLAQEKGYKLNYPNASILTGETLNCMVLLELTLLHKWLRDEFNCFIEPVTTIVNEFGKTETRYRILIVKSFPDKVGFSQREGMENDNLTATYEALKLI